MRSLPDVNVLIALLDAARVHHALARRRLAANVDHRVCGRRCVVTRP